MEVVASLSQGRTAAAQCGLFTQKSVPVIFEPPCIIYRKPTQSRDIYLCLSYGVTFTTQLVCVIQLILTQMLYLLKLLHRTCYL